MSFFNGNIVCQPCMPVSPRSPTDVYKGCRRKRSCLGHKETIFGLAFSECGNYLATASQDSTVRIWNVSGNRSILILKGHDIKYECLRVAWSSQGWGANILRSLAPSNICSKEYILASSGADGSVKIWRVNMRENPSGECLTTMDHCVLPQQIAKKRKLGEDEDDVVSDEDANTPQVYTLQFIEKWERAGNTTDVNAIMTSSDDRITVWELVKLHSRHEKDLNDENSVGPDSGFAMRKIIVFMFTDLSAGGGGVSVDFSLTSTSYRDEKGLSQTSDMNTGDLKSSHIFGGERNPDKLVYVFDASFSSSNFLIAAALSDGSCRLVNTHGSCVCVLHLPDIHSHLTSVAWDKRGKRLATCVASGHLICWEIKCDYFSEALVPQCRAIYAGGHDEGSSVYGALFCGGNDEEILCSWGTDGKLCCWESWNVGHVNAPLSVIPTQKEYPVYAVDIHEIYSINSEVESNAEKGVSNEKNQSSLISAHIALAGGRDGFIGVPVFLYDF